MEHYVYICEPSECTFHNEGKLFILHDNFYALLNLNHFVRTNIPKIFNNNFIERPEG